MHRKSLQLEQGRVFAYFIYKLLTYFCDSLLPLHVGHAVTAPAAVCLILSQDKIVWWILYKIMKR